MELEISDFEVLEKKNEQGSRSKTAKVSSMEPMASLARVVQEGQVVPRANKGFSKFTITGALICAHDGKKYGGSWVSSKKENGREREGELQ
ncbi:nucleoporin SEH1-like [Pyrus ussuriensis x Pyrus communis]|uniref:Nucleoporin SEH1-like n=1 Tax=Pyrus ussuriensis x Pyrus communis TaxID=2448454 RepID=A0A5N5FBS8_9ROSA|nr:nucleoporin SEH1-like [Pyrus ussuriensis x Pyrus communis]